MLFYQANGDWIVWTAKCVSNSLVEDIWEAVFIFTYPTQIIQCI